MKAKTAHFPGRGKKDIVSISCVLQTLKLYNGRELIANKEAKR